jgi:hypothetical protein
MSVLGRRRGRRKGGRMVVDYPYQFNLEISLAILNDPSSPMMSSVVSRTGWLVISLSLSLPNGGGGERGKSDAKKNNTY